MGERRGEGGGQISGCYLVDILAMLVRFNYSRVGGRTHETSMSNRTSLCSQMVSTAARRCGRAEEEEDDEEEEEDIADTHTHTQFPKCYIRLCAVVEMVCCCRVRVGRGGKVEQLPTCTYATVF